MNSREATNYLKALAILAVCTNHFINGYITDSLSDAYIADNLFRKRDPRFVGADRSLPGTPPAGTGKIDKKPPPFSTGDFVFPEDLSHCICPAGKRLYRSGNNVAVRGFLATKFKGPKSACVPCKLRS